MTEEEFWGMTPRVFFNAVEGFESLRKTDLEVARLQTLCNINVWAGKDPITDPRILWKYPWEKDISRVSAKDTIERGKRFGDKLERIKIRHGK